MAGERRSTARAAAAASDGETGMRFLRALAKLPGGVASWLGERFEFEDSVMAVLRHPVPRELERPVGWWYVLGSATLGIFVMQVVTGVGLAMTYVPAPNSAYDSLQFISHDAALGGVVRGMHYFGAGAMVILVLAHMTQVYLFGAFKFPARPTGSPDRCSCSRRSPWRSPDSCCAGIRTRSGRSWSLPNR